MAPIGGNVGKDVPLSKVENSQMKIKWSAKLG